MALNVAMGIEILAIGLTSPLSRPVELETTIEANSLKIVSFSHGCHLLLLKLYAQISIA